MNKNQAVLLIEKVFHDLLSPDYISRIEVLYHPDVALEMGGEAACYNDVVNRARFRQQHYLNITSEIQEVIAEGDKVAAYIKQHITDKTGRQQTLINMLIYQVQDGKIIKAWGTFSPNINYIVG